MEVGLHSEIMSFPPSPPSGFIVRPEDFNVLSRHVKWEDDSFFGKEMRDVAWEYIRCTKRLIEKMNEGNYDAVIFLDKSARPVSWLVDKFWQKMSKKNEEKKPMDMPKRLFLNINGRSLFWKEIESFLATDGQDIVKKEMESNNAKNDLSWQNDKKDEKNDKFKEKILAFRAVFHKGKLSAKNWTKEVLKKSDLDGKRILIVDEVMATGCSLDVAKQMIGAAFPDSSVNGVYFWDSKFSINYDGSLKMNSSPAWYSRKYVSGRGIGDVDETYYKDNSDVRFRVGSFILSTPYRENKTRVKTVVKNGIVEKEMEDLGRERVVDLWAKLLREDINKLYEAHSQCFK